MKSLILIFTISFFAISNAYAQYYSTLPKGIRLFTGRHIETKVESSYNRTKTETPYAYEFKANVKNLEQIQNETVQDALDLFKPYPEAYKKLSLGTHALDGNADLKVDVYGFAYGVTDRITAYMGIPIYDASVQVKYKRSKDSSQKEVAEILQREYGDDFAQGLGNTVEKFYNIDENLIQSALVNTLGYKPLGSWSGKGPGDIEFGVMYNFLKREKYGLLLTLGGVAPTGYVDDPDLLQDIGFGDGQWDAFAEFGGGYHLANWLVLDSYARYTHQFASDKYLRIPYSEDVPLSDLKGKFREKLGNKVTLATGMGFVPADWISFSGQYIYEHTEKAKYESNNKLANEVLAAESESYANSMKWVMELSSVKAYLKQKFILPGKFKVSYQTMLEGRNTPKVDLYEIGYTFFF